MTEQIFGIILIAVGCFVMGLGVGLKTGRSMPSPDGIKS